MRCRICDKEDASVFDPKAKELLCTECATSIQEATGVPWYGKEIEETLEEIDSDE